METILELLRQLWLDLQQGQLPDVGSWNYMVMGFFLMVQGRASAVVSGIAAATGYLNLGLIILIALLARVVVDVFWYKFGTIGAIDRLGRRVETVQRINIQIEDELSRRPARFMFVAKLFSGLGVPLLVSIGNSGVPIRRWLPASFAGEFVWTMPLLLLGYFTTDALSRIDGNLSYLSLVGTLVISAIFIIRSIVSGRNRSQA
jgi:membrane protein DedA with SNARE-associated domain